MGELQFNHALAHRQVDRIHGQHPPSETDCLLVCIACHGRVDRMPLMWKAEPLTMEWCLDCHRHPERHLREPGEIYNMAWAPSESAQLETGSDLVRRNRIEVDRLINCSVCHR